MLRHDVVARGGITLPRLDAALEPASLRAEPTPAPLHLVPPEVDHRRWRRAGFGHVPSTLLIDLFAALTASWLLSLSQYSGLMLTLMFVVLNCGGGHYRASIAPSLLDELPSLVGRALVAGAIATSLRVFGGLPIHNGVVYAAIVCALLAVVGRAVAYPLLRVHRSSGGNGDPTIIVGCGKVGQKLANTLLEHPEYGLWPVGYVDDSPRLEPDDRPIPVIGGLGELAELLRTYRIRNVIVAFTTSGESSMVEALRTCDRMSCEIFFVPRFYELHGAKTGTESLWDIPLTRLNRASYRTLMWRSKRVFDVVLAGLALVFLSPVMLACAIAVRIEGGPGVIYRQERVGVDGRTFEILKFRSMKPLDEDTGGLWNIGDDPRVGTVGRTLRKFSLDELPQLWNIVRGDMSIVGPRPERPSFVEVFSLEFPRYVARHRVPVGLTGWAQVNGLRGDTDIGDRVAFDNYYIENWSMWSDLKIMMRTMGQVVGGGGR
jgi:exopolysaccharide biosynthesis polyprenyl glycosylphosphotransferase